MCPLPAPPHALQRNSLCFWHRATLASWVIQAPSMEGPPISCLSLPPGPLEGRKHCGCPLGDGVSLDLRPGEGGGDHRAHSTSSPHTHQVLPTSPPPAPSEPDLTEPREEQPAVPSPPVEEEEEEEEEEETEEEEEDEEEEEEEDSQVQGEQPKVCVWGRRG